MRKKKRNNKHKSHPAIVESLKERKKVRSLGYENVEEYQKGLSTVSKLLSQKKTNERYEDYERCHAQKDGDCEWSECPQLRDGEPAKTGRHCPIDTWVDDDE